MSRFGKLHDTPIGKLKGVGPSRTETLRRLGLLTLGDLINHFPRRYDDFRIITNLCDLREGAVVTVRVTVQTGAQQKRSGRMTVTRVPAADGTGVVEAIWFNQPYILQTLKPQQQLWVTGSAQRRLGKWQILVREYASAEEGQARGIIPVYRSCAGVTQKLLRSLVLQSIQAAEPLVNDQWPQEWLSRLHLPPLWDALREVHFPSSWETLSRARSRLIFDELMFLRLSMKQLGHQAGIAHAGLPELLPRLSGALPYSLTHAQLRCISEVFTDMEAQTPMRRILQGDVGSGKTIIAAAALFKAACSGFQAALLVPTELLAEQHFRFLKRVAGCFGLDVRLLTGGLSTSEKKAIIVAMQQGQAQVIVGTHSLLEEQISIPKLSLLVIDEQHRFGVAQRERLGSRGRPCDILSISATPIPRSLAMVLYGSVAVSNLDEIPPGRSPIKTYWVGPEKENGLLGFCAQEMAAGHQVYWVCPSITSGENDDSVASVEERLPKLKAAWTRATIATIHGRMTASARDAVMRDFAAGRIDALVATTVIEVGVDIPNATVMVIEDADRFGLAQLHQLRGRVGRGQYQSHCVLLAVPRTKTGQERLTSITRTTDGFLIAKADLKLRGPGEVLGTSQHGYGDLLINQWQSEWELVDNVALLANEVIHQPDRLTPDQWAWLLNSAQERFRVDLS